MLETQNLQIENWHLRVRVPQGSGPHPVMLLLHGWMGDEDAMWVFAHRLPKDRLLIAPRAPHPAPNNGRSWVGHRSSAFSTLDDFHPAVDALIERITMLSDRYAGDFSTIDLVGLSQGAALSYSFAVLHPERVRAVAGLAGFVPKGIGKMTGHRPLSGKRVFVAHGTQDKVVPIAMAREGARILEEAGAAVTFCEDDVGHKLSSSCYRAMGRFFGSP